MGSPDFVSRSPGVLLLNVCRVGEREFLAAVRGAASDPARFQPLTSEDREVYGDPAFVLLDPPLTDDPASAEKRRCWLDWRGAPYPAERHSEYVFLPRDLDEPHPRILLSAVLDVGAGLERHLAQFDKKQRYDVTGRKAANAGFFACAIRPADHAAEIWSIIHSTDRRQGRPISESFRTRSQNYTFPEYKVYTDPAYRDICIGAFSPDRRLVAYILGKRVGDHVQYDEIMGHVDFVHMNVMLLAHHAFLKAVTKQETIPRCLNYGPWYSGANAFSSDGGLNFWKRKNRFRPAYLIAACC